MCALHHVQVAGPPGCEARMREYYVALGFTEIPKPPLLAVRGGCWFRLGDAELHVGIEDPFAPARKAHPAFEVELDAMAAAVTAAGAEPAWADPAEWGDSHLAGLRRFHTVDPVGNRLEFVGA